MTQRPTILRLAIAATFLVVLAACGEQTPPTTQNSVTVAVEGTGTGTVTSTPAGINVTSGDAADTFDFDDGTEVTLTAEAATGSTFAGWGGDCAGAGMGADCVFTLDDDATVTATFTQDVVVEGPFDLTVQKTGAGDGTVTSDVGGIDLAVGETEETAVDLAEGTVVTLTAAADGASVFNGWSGGGCTGTDATCVVTMDADTTVTASFVVPGGEVTESFTILQESDDAEEYVNFINDAYPAGSVDLVSSDLDLAFDEAGDPDRGEVIVGLRFGNVTVPQGSTITSATITFARINSEGTTTFQIQGQAADDAGTFVYVDSVGNNDISGRPTTAASVEWVQATTPDPTIETTDLATIVQEIVDRGGWASGNALVFVIDSDDSDVSNNIAVDTFGGVPAVLEITYTTPAE